MKDSRMSRKQWNRVALAIGTCAANGFEPVELSVVTLNRVNNYKEDRHNPVKRATVIMWNRHLEKQNISLRFVLEPSKKYKKRLDISIKEGSDIITASDDVWQVLENAPGDCKDCTWALRQAKDRAKYFQKFTEGNKDLLEKKNTSKDNSGVVKATVEIPMEAILELEDFLRKHNGKLFAENNVKHYIKTQKEILKLKEGVESLELRLKQKKDALEKFQKSL